MRGETLKCTQKSQGQKRQLFTFWFVVSFFTLFINVVHGTTTRHAYNYDDDPGVTLQ